VGVAHCWALEWAWHTDEMLEWAWHPAESTGVTVLGGLWAESGRGTLLKQTSAGRI